MIYVCEKISFWSEPLACYDTFQPLQHLNASFRNSVLEQNLICDMKWLHTVLGEY